MDSDFAVIKPAEVTFRIPVKSLMGLTPVHDLTKQYLGVKSAWEQNL
jgi:hypothetical protein